MMKPMPIDHQHNRYQLTIRCQQQTAALERLLRVVRFRGFLVENITAGVDKASGSLAITLVVSGTRPITFLTRQLLKNREVIDIITAQ